MDKRPPEEITRACEIWVRGIHLPPAMRREARAVLADYLPRALVFRWGDWIVAWNAGHDGPAFLPVDNPIWKECRVYVDPTAWELIRAWGAREGPRGRSSATGG